MITTLVRLSLFSSLGITALDNKPLVQELNTSDFLVTHIHAFTLHTTLTVLLKGLFYTRSSRLVPDKTLALDTLVMVQEEEELA